LADIGEVMAKKNRSQNKPNQPASAKFSKAITPSQLVSLNNYLPFLISGIFFVLYAVLTVMRHRRLETTGFDLGIFEQEVRSYANFHFPVSDLKAPGFPLLGDHFSPITILIAPFYRVHPSAETLLVAQALLIAIAIVPICKLAIKKLSPLAGGIIAIGFGVSTGIMNMVIFDFHEVAFAVPIIAFSCVALVEKQYQKAAYWAAALIFVKEDLGFTVAAIGLLIAFKGERKIGFILAASGFISTLLLAYAVIPAINPDNVYPYRNNFSLNPWHDFQALLLPDTKLTTICYLLIPTAFSALGSSIFLITLPTLAGRFISENSSNWSSGFHYDAVLVPIVFVAMIDTLSRSNELTRRNILAGSIAVSIILGSQGHLTELKDHDLWHHTPRVEQIHSMLNSIPSGTSVMTSNSLAPQLTSNHLVTLLGMTDISAASPEYLAVDTNDIAWPIGTEQKMQLVNSALASGYKTEQSFDGVYLLHRTK